VDRRERGKEITKRQKSRKDERRRTKKPVRLRAPIMT
jgi:hypothetical protein